MTPNQTAKIDRLVWVDCEMTGLDTSRHVLVEIAVVVTDAELKPLDKGIDIVIHATEDELAEMDDFVTKMHGTSGLTEEIRQSTVSVADAEKQVVEYIRQFVASSGVAPLCGNSIASDRKFIAKYMPDLDNFLHYRMIDVSSIKELTRRWYPGSTAASRPRACSTARWRTFSSPSASWTTTVGPPSSPMLRTRTRWTQPLPQPWRRHRSARPTCAFVLNDRRGLV